FLVAGSCSERVTVSKMGDPEALRKFSTLSVDAEPDSVYNTFNAFCLNYYGWQADPGVYARLGNVLEEKTSGRWQYISERSAVLAWETNPPARTYVEYGTTRKLERRTPLPERFFFGHAHYLRGLLPETEYHY